MVFEGVTFVESAIETMTKSKFIAAHVNVLWQDRTDKQRRQMLSDVYDLIVPPKEEDNLK